jgi:hypothetical protein
MCVEFKMAASTTKLITLMVYQVVQIKEIQKDQDVDDRINISHFENWKVAATGTRAKITCISSRRRRRRRRRIII